MKKTIDDDDDDGGRGDRHHSFHAPFTLYSIFYIQVNSFMRSVFCGHSEKLFRSNGPLKQFSATSDFVRCQRTHARAKKTKKKWRTTLCAR